MVKRKQTQVIVDSDSDPETTDQRHPYSGRERPDLPTATSRGEAPDAGRELARPDPATHADGSGREGPPALEQVRIDKIFAKRPGPAPAPPPTKRKSKETLN